MSSRLVELFNDVKLVQKIQEKLPSLFYLAELENSRGNKVGMNVGSAREQILIALLMYKFGELNVQTDSIIEPDVDARLFGNPVSIKTFTVKSATALGSVKAIWTTGLATSR